VSAGIQLFRIQNDNHTGNVFLLLPNFSLFLKKNNKKMKRVYCYILSICLLCCIWTRRINHTYNFTTRDCIVNTICIPYTNRARPFVKGGARRYTRGGQRRRWTCMRAKEGIYRWKAMPEYILTFYRRAFWLWSDSSSRYS